MDAHKTTKYLGHFGRLYLPGQAQSKLEKLEKKQDI